MEWKDQGQKVDPDPSHPRLASAARGGRSGWWEAVLQAHSPGTSLRMHRCLLVRLRMHRRIPVNRTHLREWMRLNSGSSCRWKIPEAKPVTKRWVFL